MNGDCTAVRFPCEYCDCSGISCQSRFPGSKVVWPELKGVSAPEAKRMIESDNPHVSGVIIPEDVRVVEVYCCNRVVLRVPVGNCPNGPVVNIPLIG
ncbi:hypothetical protein EUTSA_v10010855mg [Eutrema salsugineum]|uniref:Serine protease inhibitor, potato inhibitor I-type family protein n=1 Tax=Eutrema salsugineum TaxID=72664 RepID=V4NH80_EUTSA|nr:inhibitor of trypsin and hageman factor [Eutrema salsugineum]ESQ45516.1 hypothetical protein EUTSA_v10010855mg [Eutrema salsugineum]